MPIEPTIRDALIAEMLGDIGLLHEAVQQLLTTLPQEVASAQDKLTEMIGLLNKAGVAYRQQAKSFTAAELQAVRTQLRADLEVARATLTSDLSETHADLEKGVEQALEGLSRSVHGAIRSSLSELLPGVFGTQRWVTAGLCLGSALIGAATALGIHSIAH